MALDRQSSVNIAIFASGGGTNADKICSYFKHDRQIHVALIISNKKSAGVHQIAEKHGINSYHKSKEEINSENKLLPLLEQYRIDFIVLAGFLLLVPKFLVTAFPKRMLNIHPALLPKYGGKGMYGMYVHEAVYKNQEIETGITIHYVNENYDEGNIIYQAKCKLQESDQANKIAQKVRKLEHKHFPRIIEEVIHKELIR